MRKEERERVVRFPGISGISGTTPLGAEVWGNRGRAGSEGAHRGRPRFGRKGRLGKSEELGKEWLVCEKGPGMGSSG